MIIVSVLAAMHVHACTVDVPESLCVYVLCLILSNQFCVVPIGSTRCSRGLSYKSCQCLKLMPFLQTLKRESLYNFVNLGRTILFTPI